MYLVDLDKVESNIVSKSLDGKWYEFYDAAGVGVELHPINVTEIHNIVNENECELEEEKQ